MDLAPAVAVVISITYIVVGWFVYDALCKLLGKNEMVLLAVLFLYVAFAAWFAFQVFGARAAYIHVGVMLGTMMVANVAHVIIPGQRKMVAAIRARRKPDPAPWIRG